MTQSKGKCTFMKILFHFIFMDIYVCVLGCKLLLTVGLSKTKQTKQKPSESHYVKNGKDFKEENELGE